MFQRKSDNHWVERVQLANGKYKTFYSNAATRRKAEKEIQQKIFEFRGVEKKNSTYKEVADRWKYEHWEQISLGTQRNYNAPFNNLRENFDNAEMSDITVRDINLFFERLKTQGYALKTIKTHRILLNLIFKYAYINGIINENIIAYTSLPSGMKYGKRQPPEDEQIELVKNSVDCHFGIFAYFILYTGLRRGEALALTEKDIDFENHLIHVNKSVTYNGNHPIIGETKTENGIRDVFLLPNVEEKIKGFKGYLFGGGTEPMTEMAFRRAYEHYKRDSGVTLTAHQLRHAYAMILYEANVSDKDAQELMGHADIHTTRNIYTHISDAQKKRAFEKLSKFCGENA